MWWDWWLLTNLVCFDLLAARDCQVVVQLVKAGSQVGRALCRVTASETGNHLRRTVEAGNDHRWPVHARGVRPRASRPDEVFPQRRRSLSIVGKMPRDLVRVLKTKAKVFTNLNLRPLCAHQKLFYSGGSISEFVRISNGWCIQILNGWWRLELEWPWPQSYYNNIKRVFNLNIFFHVATPSYLMRVTSIVLKLQLLLHHVWIFHSGVYSMKHYTFWY